MSRQITLTPPGGADLDIVSMISEKDALGRMFSYELVLLSDDAAIDPLTILGEPMVVNVLLDDGSHRYFHGIVTIFRSM